MFNTFICGFLLVGSVFSIPVKDELMFEGPDDTAIVESTVREARAAPNAPSHIGDLIQPGVKDAFLYVYGDAENDDGDLHGYTKKMDDKGQDGYKHYDGFHKRDGDKYGYEKHSEYGQENKANIENENEEGLKEAHFEAEGGKGKEENEEEDDGEETRKSYAVTEELDEDDKKQPKKKVESDYSYFGDGDSGSSGYFGSEASEEDGAESAEDDGDGETEESEESEESEEGDEEEDD